MTRIATGKVRQAFAEMMNRVANGRERIVLHRRGKDVAALIPLEDLTLLEALEDRLDVREAEKVLAKLQHRLHRRTGAPDRPRNQNRPRTNGVQLYKTALSQRNFLLSRPDQLS